jgi:glycosyltransferase involved in cell wall biosynthesis
VKLVAIILTLNEERHLRRCIESIESVVDEVVVMDCYSTDATLDIANELGARVLQKAWVNYATQFNYALTQLTENVDWVLRIDADEYLTPALASEISQNMANLSSDLDGVTVPRRLTFMGRLIRHGGVFPVQVLRLFRYGAGECENRWMDEHIKVAGKTVNFKHELIDDNLNSLSWWVNKHNNYASREVVDLLNLEYGFMAHDTVASLSDGSQASLKRWIKEKVYAGLPGGFRAFAYFCYRYFLRLGFLDGREGTAFHVLQGFWYRYLVDAKLAEVKRYILANSCSVQQGILDVLDIDVLVLKKSK